MKEETKSHEFWGVNCSKCEAPILVCPHEHVRPIEEGQIRGLTCQNNPREHNYSASDLRVFEVTELA
jgi:hypothetical protein